MKLYGETSSFKEMMRTSGIYNEYEYDEFIEAYERTDTYYMVPSSKDKVVSVATGEVVEHISNSDGKRRWQLICLLK